VHEENTAAVAEILGQHRAVSRLHYPGCIGHPGHAIARKQQDGFGALISFELAGGEQAVRRFVDGLQCISLAESLGGVESLVAHPTTMSHASMDDEARKVAGIHPGLLRFSVGIEDADDLVADLIAALDRAAAPALKEAC
jgi:cystathionine gamma-synthase